MTLLTGGANCIKYVLFAFNFLFAITGIIIMSVGVTVTAVYDGYTPFLDPQFLSIPTFLVVIGSFIFFIAFFGCCGAIKENYCMTLTFAGLLIFIFILELAAGISGYVLRNDTAALIDNELNKTMQTYGEKGHGQSTELWDIVQRRFECCGLHNYTDWSKALKPESTDLPMSCCRIEYGVIGNETCNYATENKRIFYKPCGPAFAEFISSHALSLGAAGIGLAIIQFAGIFFACYVAKEIKARNGGIGPF